MTDHSRLIEDPTVEMILVKLARKYAPHLAPALWHRPGDLGRPLPLLARQLANEGLLVVLGDRSTHPSAAIPGAVTECAQMYVALYGLLAGALYSRLTRISSFYYSFSRSSLVLCFEADAAPVIQALAGYVAPYAAAHVRGAPIPPAELAAVMDAVLKRVEARGLPAATYGELHKGGCAVIRRMMRLALRQLPLIPFDDPLLAPRQPPPVPSTLPGINPPPAAPPQPPPAPPVPGQRPPYLMPDAPVEGDTTRPDTDMGQSTTLPYMPGPHHGDTTAPAPLPYWPDETEKRDQRPHDGASRR